MKPLYDVVIIGASFAGATLAHHLPKNIRVLMVDAKPAPGASVESTGLITTKTYQEFASFFPIERYITNPISSICVVATDFQTHFTSSTKEPWIFQTDTKRLVADLVGGVSSLVEVRMKTVLKSASRGSDGMWEVSVQTAGESEQVVRCRVLVGADGSHSKVAQVSGLERNQRFLFGYEAVHFGSVHLGPNPEQTIYHYWFGDFSLGYGGWLSPTVVDGRAAVRIGLAKNRKDRGEAKELLAQFTRRLIEQGVLRVDGAVEKPHYIFGSLIPIGGALRRIAGSGVVLIGDAAGFCGAFAADGIKGCIVSGKESAKLIVRELAGERGALGGLRGAMQERGLLEYYARQVRYRWIWDCMKRNRTFDAMFGIIARERETFVEQFCDSKDKRRSLAWTVLKWRHIVHLARYAWFLLVDILLSPRRGATRSREPV